MGFFSKSEDPTGKYPGEHWQDDSSTQCVFVPEKMRKEIEKEILREVRNELIEIEKETHDETRAYVVFNKIARLFSPGRKFEVRDE